MKSLFNHLILVSLVGVFVGCAPQTAKESNTESVFNVRAQVVGTSTPEQIYSYVGAIEADRTTAISFSVGGGVERIYVDEGQRVAKGAVLAQLNSDNLSDIYEAAKAKRLQAQDGMRRVEIMNETQSIAPVKYVEMQTQLREAQSMEAVSKRNLEDSRLISPVSGVVGRRMVEVGENVAPHQVVLEILSVGDGVVAKLPIPEGEIAKISIKDSVKVTIAALGGRTFDGVVVRKGVKADPISRTYMVHARIANSDLLLLPGMVCRAEVTPNGEVSESISIPSAAVRGGVGGAKYVWVINGDRVSRREIQSGAITNKGVEISGGLMSGDEVVIAGSAKLYEGAKVKKVSHE